MLPVRAQEEVRNMLLETGEREATESLVKLCPAINDLKSRASD